MSASRYIARVPKRAIRVEDDWWPANRETLDVIVTDDGAVKTGLVDQHGTLIMRLPSRGPLGFCR